MRLYHFIIICLLASIIPSMLYASAVESGHKLGPGDRIKVTVLDEPDVTREVTLDKDGKVNLALIGNVSLIGMTCADAADSIQHALTEYIVKPDVSVELLDIGKMRIFVVGEVKKPGLLLMPPGTKLLEAITLAEYSENSDLAKISLHRNEQVTNIDLTVFLTGSDLSRNILLQSEDTIVVTRQNMLHEALVLGEVTKPGTTTLKAQMTFRELLAAAGGVTPEADTSKITVKRAGTNETMAVNYINAIKGEAAADIVMQSGDTVYVPKAENSYFIIQGGVNQPGRYPYKPNITIEEAAAIAGGFTKDAKVHEIQLVHANGSSDRSQAVNLASVRNGSAPTITLQPKDTIVVPQRKVEEWYQILTSAAALGWLFHP